MRRTRLLGWAATGAVTLLVGVQIAIEVAGAGPASATSGTEVVVARSGYGTWQSNAAMAYCPAGRKVLGGGGKVVDGDGSVMLTELSPVAGLEGFRAAASAFAGGQGRAWEVAAYAICGDPLPGLQHVSVRSDAPPGATYHESTATCPAGKKVVGAGATVAGSNDSVQWVRPYDHGTHGSVVVAAIHDTTTATGPTLRVWAVAVCADPPAGYEIGATGTAAYTGRYLQTSVRCAPGKKLLGAGLTKSDTQGTGHVDAMYPTTSPTVVPPTHGAPGSGAVPDTVWVSSRQPAASNPVNLGAWAICAD